MLVQCLPQYLDYVQAIIIKMYELSTMVRSIITFVVADELCHSVLAYMVLLLLYKQCNYVGCAGVLYMSCRRYSACNSN